jgi:signal transduction histidine kinase
LLLLLPTVRGRLTLVYWSLSVLFALGLLGIAYVLARARLLPAHPLRALVAAARADGLPSERFTPPITAFDARHIADTVLAERANALHEFLLVSAIALGIMLVVSACAGWLVAGRMLRPLRVMAGRAQRISAENLHQRLAMAGPRDELTTLGAAFDGLLGRLEQAFAAQRQFAANVSHELRTPLTLQRAMVEVALADEHASAGRLRAACERVLAASEQQERLIEALFTLAKGQRGLDRTEPLDLAAVADEIVLTRAAEAESAGLTVATALRPAPAAGDLPLAERLVDNLLANAIRYNLPGGRVEVVTGTDGPDAVLVVVNTGPVIGEQEVGGLFEPFRRTGEQRAGRHDGLGLGLPIAAAIAAAHGGTVSARPEAGGGLAVEARFPLAAAPAPALSQPGA